MREDGSVVPPMNFIPLAESSGRIEAMTWQLLDRALADLQPHLKADKNFKLSFNVVPKHLLTPGFVDTLRATVSTARVSARQVVV
ncbi:EAL domain-containing protein, partial [Acinetobacter baumannii]